VCDEARNAVLSRERAAVLSRVLGGEFGFVGVTETYDAPGNADFSRVLDRKRRLLISPRQRMRTLSLRRSSAFSRNPTNP
jgi:hypothetical protein